MATRLDHAALKRPKQFVHRDLSKYGMQIPHTYAAHYVPTFCGAATIRADYCSKGGSSRVEKVQQTIESDKDAPKRDNL